MIPVITNKRFNVILADCPWQYRNYTDSAHGAAVSAMQTMSNESIAAVPVKRWASDRCLLAMWAVYPKLPEAIAIAYCWGFTDYITAIPWVKTAASTGNIHTGIGYWIQGCSELLLLFRNHKKVNKKKGHNVKGLLTGKPYTFYCPKGSIHSNKPEELQCWLERIRDGPYLELFARRQRHNWQCWGIDTGYYLTQDGVFKIN